MLEATDLFTGVRAHDEPVTGMWRDNNVRTTYGEAAKHVRHPVTGLIVLESSVFAVDGRPDLGMVIYNPATPADADRIRTLIKRKWSAKPAHGPLRHSVQRSSLVANEVKRIWRDHPKSAARDPSATWLQLGRNTSRRLTYTSVVFFFTIPQS